MGKIDRPPMENTSTNNPASSSPSSSSSSISSSSILSSSFTFPPYSQCTIATLKEAYFPSEIQTNKRIRILYAGKELRDENYIKDCNLHDNAVLHAVVTAQSQSGRGSLSGGSGNGVMNGGLNMMNNSSTLGNLYSSSSSFSSSNRNTNSANTSGQRGRNRSAGNGSSSSSFSSSSNSDSVRRHRRIEQSIFFFLLFILLFIIWWAIYMYPSSFSKTSHNIMSVFTGIYFICLLHFVL